MNVEGRRYGKPEQMLECVREWLVEAVPPELFGYPMDRMWTWTDAWFRPLEQAKQWIRDLDAKPSWHLAAAMKLATSREPHRVSVGDLLECLLRGGGAAEFGVRALSTRIGQIVTGGVERRAVQDQTVEALHIELAAANSFAELVAILNRLVEALSSVGLEARLFDEDGESMLVYLVDIDDAHGFTLQVVWDLEEGVSLCCAFEDDGARRVLACSPTGELVELSGYP